MQDIALKPIATIHSPYKQKFAIPRQPRLVTQAKAQCVFLPPFNREEFVRGLDEFSHIWLIFQFHETADKGYSALVRPPRLGGNAKKGVFATRSTFRPNSLGMSAVKLEQVCYEKGKLWLELSGIDLLDGTPIVDIKPYVPYSDNIENVQAGYAQSEPDTPLKVAFNDDALKQCKHYQKQYPHLHELISQVLAQDPRPAYKKQNQACQEYGMSLYDFNICWQVENQLNTVLEITQIS